MAEEVTGFGDTPDDRLRSFIGVWQMELDEAITELERRGYTMAWELRPGKGGLPFRVVIGRAHVDAAGADITGDAAALDSVGGEQQP